MAKGIRGNVPAIEESGARSPEAVAALERPLSALKLVCDNQADRTGSEHRSSRNFPAFFEEELRFCRKTAEL